MKHGIKKIGLIQTSPLTADFSNNLRAIVQGYRDCIDHGAELVIAPACALCGPEPQDLGKRCSFLAQTQAALNSLSHELGNAPLLLGAYQGIYMDEDSGEMIELTQPNSLLDDESPDNHFAWDVPYLIEKDTVSELEEGEIININGMQIFVDLQDREDGLDMLDVDLIIHLPKTPWYSGCLAKQDDRAAWESITNRCPVVICRHVGACGEHIYGGGSCIFNGNAAPLARLPLFETAFRCISFSSKGTAHGSPSAVEELSMALERGLRDFVRNNGYSGVCIPLNHPHAALLACIAVSALGSSNVQGYSFGAETKAAKALGIDIKELPLPSLPKEWKNLLPEDGAEEFRLRCQSSLLYSLACNCGMMLLCPLSRHEIMQGRFIAYADSIGSIAPLGSLYEMDIYLLSKFYSEKHPDVFGSLAEPSAAEQDRIIHYLADLNLSASKLIDLERDVLKENDVRLMQRRIIASELKRRSLPCILQTAPPEEQLHMPLTQRLND